MSGQGHQRENVLALIRQGLDSRDIAAQLGISPGTVAAFRANLTRGTYGSTAHDAMQSGLPSELGTSLHGIETDLGTSHEVIEALDGIISLERDLQTALRRNIDQLEVGLKVIDDGKEKTVPSGRIGIAAQDSAGSAVVIELKAKEADQDAVARLLGYMGGMMAHGLTVRGILTAESKTGGRRKKLDAAKCHEIAESVISGRKTGAEMARLDNVSAPIVSCMMAAHRTGMFHVADSVR